jgi:hypothetical protein
MAAFAFGLGISDTIDLGWEYLHASLRGHEVL